MTGIKKGDRVHVGIDGTVVTGPNYWGMHRVSLDDGRYTWAAAEHCTKIAPPVKVGDVVTAENIGQLPDRSLVAAHGWEPFIKFGDTWYEINPFHFVEGDPLGFGLPVVLRIGGTS